jgi:DNA-binding NtrC family response regulator
MTETKYRVLIVDDEKNLRDSLAEFFALDGYSCPGAASGEEGLAMLSREVFDAVLLDLRMPGLDGLAVLAKIREEGTGIPVIMMSAHGEIPDAVTAMKLGAVDYLVKPFDPNELALRLERAILDSRLIRMARVGLRLSEEGGRILRSEDPGMKEILSMVAKVAPAPSSVLITGESGTGKEVIAREIHRLSSRSEGPFVPVNVGSIPESLLESELFGYEKGAFTGADSRKSGLFELASGGTLFLDEIGEMPLSTQVKLLRVLQDRVLMRVGGLRPIPVDIRVVTATNRDMERAVQDGSFREDLYFRINVIHLRLPPLRNRPLDVAPLAGFFLARFAKDMKKSITGISGEALRLLESYPFPGNIRELENCIERAVILCEGNELSPRDFALEGRLRPQAIVPRPDFDGLPPEAEAVAPVPEAANPAESGPVSMKDAEKRAIIIALARNRGHRERSSRELGISRRTLLTKIKEYNLEV